MGNCTSSSHSPLTVSTHGSPQKESLLTPTTIASSPYPSPRPRNDVATFSIMRNGYHVLRGCMDHIMQLLEDGNFDDAAGSYSRFVKWSRLYRRMELGTQDKKESSSSPKGLFSILDEYYDGIIEKNNLRQDNVELLQAEKDFESAIKTEDVHLIVSAFKKFKAAYEMHLLEKEAIVMSRVVEMKLYQFNMKEIMVDEILPLIYMDEDNMKFFLQHANYVLDNDIEGLPRVVSFDHAVWTCATPSQWKKWGNWIKQSLSKESFDSFKNAISF